jgi:hypothetical protein
MKSAGLFDDAQGKIDAVGWAGFFDVRFAAESTAAMLLAILLGAAIAFHPVTALRSNAHHQHQKAEMRKVYVMYAFIGAVIGLTVREFGMVIGVVVFGIGGLIRFRTATESTVDTGCLIVVTLAGLIAGLGLPHVAVISVAVAWVLILMFEVRPSSRVRIANLPAGRVAECADAYREILQLKGCRILSDHRTAHKARVEFSYRTPKHVTQDHLHAAFAQIPQDLKGDVDWELE